MARLGVPNSALAAIGVLTAVKGLLVTMAADYVVAAEILGFSCAMAEKPGQITLVYMSPLPALLPCSCNIQGKYERVRERFTWRRHVTEEGLKALSPIKNQFHRWCLYFSTATTMESIFRLLEGRDIFFSVQHLKELSDEAKQQFPNITSTKRLLEKLLHAGVLSVTDYQRRPQYGYRYCVSNLRCYDLDNIHHIKDALYELQRGGPLLAVIRISKNYDECWHSGEVYKYDPSNVHGDSAQPPTHALSVICFALENGPFFECQDSHGIRFGAGGFLKVDVTSFKELYSFKVVEVFGDWTG